MEKKRDLFDIMQDFEPEDKLFTDECEKAEVERIKRQVFRRKGAGLVRLRIIKRTAAAVLAIVLLAGGAIGVDAATGGHVMKKVKETLTVTVEKPDGTKEKLGVDKIEEVKTEDGSVFVVKVSKQKKKDGESTVYMQIDEEKEKGKDNKSKK